MLRLVRPPTEGQDPPVRRRKGHKPDALFLTPEERRHVRTALRNTARAYGGFDVLAVVMAVPAPTLYSAAVPRRSLSGTFAIRLAKAAGVSVETLLAGTFTDASRCGACGARLGAGGGR